MENKEVKIEINRNDLDPITSMYPRTMIDPRYFTKAKVNELFGSNPKETEEPKAETQEEEYVWVEGYKGTDKNMCCRGYQYELDKKFNMPDDAAIKLCDSGFHLCPKLNQVFSYYSPIKGNRFFKVMALVPKKQTEMQTYSTSFGSFDSNPDKYAAKSIVFLSECSPREILNATYGEKAIEGYSDAELAEAIETSFLDVKTRKQVAELVDLGYAKEIAEIAYAEERMNLAKALAKQPNISWDARITALVSSFYHDDD